MIKTRILLITAALIITPVYSAQKTVPQLHTEIDTSFATNGAGAITAEVLRNVTKDIVDSFLNLLSTAPANSFYGGPTSGADATPSFRPIVGVDLPAPGPASLGGIQSAAPQTSKWVSSISTLGVPVLSQPDFSDLSGSIDASQVSNALDNLASCTDQGSILYRGSISWNCLTPGTTGQFLQTTGTGSDPTWADVGSTVADANFVLAGPISGAPGVATFRALIGDDLPDPTTSSLGGVQAINPVSHQWINSISTSGIPSLSQPTFADVSGILTNSQLNNSLDSLFGCATHGSIIFRNATVWECLAPGTAGQYLQTAGSGVDPTWADPASTVANANTVLAGPVSGAPATATFRALVGDDLPTPTSSTLGGVQSAAAVSNQWINSISTAGVPSLSQPGFSNLSGNLSAAQASAGLDALTSCSTQGSVLYRNGSSWVCLGPGTSGQVLQTSGAGANPVWADAASGTPVAGGFKNMMIQASNATQVTVTTDAITLENAGGQVFRATSVNVTAAITTVGANGLDTGSEAANTWYSVWVIYNPTTTTTASLLSTSATSPTMPAGYTYKARVSWVRNDASSNFFRYIQYGKRAQYTVGTNPSTPRTMATGPAALWTAIPWANFAPPTAVILHYGINNGGSTQTMYVAPNNAYAAGNAFEGFTVSVGNDTYRSSSMMVESANIYWYTSAALPMYLHGWEDNL